MQNIAVIFGGKSVEHDISIITGFSVLKNMPVSYNIIPIYIDKNGKWWTKDALFFAKTYQSKTKLDECFLASNEPKLFVKRGIMHKCIVLDCALLCVHGGLYEGGGLQGVLDLANLPYTSANIEACSVCLDKVLTKNFCKSQNINTAKYEVCNSPDYEPQKLNYPIIIKPAHLGSSVGIKIANSKTELESAIIYAQNFDSQILLEECFTDFRELNIALFKYKNQMYISSIEEIKKDGIYTFEQKYTDKTQIKRIVPAELNLKQIDNIVKKATFCYENLNLNGVVRFDMFLVNGKIYLNEINTIPGSLAFYLFKEQGISFAKLIDLLIKDALYRFANQQKIDYNFSSNVLDTLDSITNVSQK